MFWLYLSRTVGYLLSALNIFWIGLEIYNQYWSLLPFSLFGIAMTILGLRINQKTIKARYKSDRLRQHLDL